MSADEYKFATIIATLYRLWYVFETTSTVLRLINGSDSSCLDRFQEEANSDPEKAQERYWKSLKEHENDLAKWEKEESARKAEEESAPDASKRKRRRRYESPKPLPPKRSAFASSR